MCPTGYAFVHIPGELLRGGGFGLLFKESLGIQCKNSEWNTSFQSFEFLYGGFKSSKMNRDLSLLLDEMASASGELFVVGDFNLHVD